MMMVLTLTLLLRTMIISSIDDDSDANELQQVNSWCCARRQGL
jgi:hypothetical protein